MIPPTLYSIFVIVMLHFLGVLVGDESDPELVMTPLNKVLLVGLAATWVTNWLAYYSPMRPTRHEREEWMAARK